MQPFVIAFHDRAFAVEAPPSLAADVAAFFQLCEPAVPLAAIEPVVIGEDADGRYALTISGVAVAGGLTRGDVIARLAERMGRLVHFAGGNLLHAGAVGWGDKAVLILGEQGHGKSSLIAWMIERGFAYLADDNVLLLADAPGTIVGFPEPMWLRTETLAHVANLPAFHAAPSIRAGDRLFVQPDRSWLAAGPLARCGLVIEAHFRRGTGLSLEPLSPADTTLLVLAQTRRVVIPSDPQYPLVAAIGDAACGMRLTYGSYAELEGVLDFLTRAVLEMEVPPAEFEAFLRGLPRATPAAPSTPKTYPIPARSPRKFSPKLTIGMATYDDYDGVYFSLQAIRMYHPEILDQVEFLVVDNHPNGICAEPLKQLENAIPNYTYLPAADIGGTAATRNLVFSEGGGEFALCMDCHVFFVPGALRRLLAYFDEHPDTSDLLQGPLVGDDLRTLSTHFKPVWRAGMYGIWGHDSGADDPDGPPFEIPMQGLGIFACRRAAWLGFNPRFAGFGGEEGYIHEKFRQAGHRNLCLPFLRWMHRFQRPLGPPYRNTWEDRARNYTIGFRELGLPTTELEAHFAEVLGADNAERIFGVIRKELDDVRVAAE